MPFLKDILAQAPAVSVLRAAYSTGRLPHALLFAGPEGVGKGTTAEALAQLFLCTSPITSPANSVDGCGTCESCTLFAAGTHSDFHRVYRQLARIEKSEAKARDLSVDVIRDFLLEPASRSAQLGNGKVFLVEEADTMNPQAQNALLKTLEEPHGKTLIILLASQPGALLPTIRSRCQPVYFAPIPDTDLAAYLISHGTSPENAKDLARLAAGSLGLALRLASPELLATVKELESRLTTTLKGTPTPDFPKFLKTAGETLADNLLKADPQGSKDQATRESLILLLRLAGDTCRRFLRVAKSTPGLNKLCAAIDHLTLTQGHLDANVNVSLALQNLSAHLEA